MALLKRLYGAAPVWVQNIMVSAYGLRRERARHGGDFQQHVAFLLESQSWTAEQHQTYQLQRLRELVEHSCAHVPYYRSEYGRLGITAADLRTLEDLKHLPLLEKDVLRTRLAECVADCWPRRALLESHTSGSTGTPLTYFSTVADFRERMAFLERQRSWAQVNHRSRCATFTGQLIVSAQQKHGAWWRYNRPGRQLLFSSYYMSPENLPAYAARLADFKPEIIEGYPSAIYIMARWLEANGGHQVIRPRAVLSTAETLHDYQRHTIEAAFGAHVYNYYGSSECAPLITECEQGSLHVNPESGIFEFLRPDGSEADPGESAEMVVTSFATHAMPLIRYRIRDAALVGPHTACPCGRQMPQVAAVLGRLDDMLFTPDRGWVGRLSQAVKVFPGSIREAQIVQTSLDEVLINLVPDPTRFEMSQTEPLIKDLRARLGNVIHIRIQIVDHIPRGPNGKFKYVVNALPPDDKARLGLPRTATPAGGTG